MLKKIILTLLLICFSSSAFAKKGINIFTYPRKVPTARIFNQYGQSFNLADFSGNFLIVVFWSKTCIPCIKEIDDINEFIKKTNGTGIKLITVSPDKEWLSAEEQKSFLKKYGGADIDFYTDKKSNLANSFGIFTSPHTVLINSSSMEIGRIRGAIDWDNKKTIEEIYKIKAQN
jgi:peroxiredoxin